MKKVRNKSGLAAPKRKKQPSAAPAKKKTAPAKSSPRSLKQGKSPKPALSGHWVTREELGHVMDRLREAQETLDAIRSGEVDAVVVNGANGNHIYSLTGAEQPYRVFVEHMQEGAATVSAEGMVLYCNKRFAEMAHVALDRIISSQITDYIDHETWHALSTVFRKKAQGVKHEGTLVSRGKKQIPVHFTASMLPVEDHRIMCLVVTDLTQQREHAELRLAKDVADKASLAKDSFLATLSHELRTPLTPALITAVELEENRSLPEHIRHDIAMIRRNIELEARLIDDLLDLTRISHGKLELVMAEIDIHMVLRRAVEICRSNVDAKQQKLSLDLRARNHVSTGDPTRLQQVVWNLIRNAVKFTPVGGSIDITTSSTDREFKFEIKDTGIGFEPAAAGILFRPFEQAGRDITKQFGGLGLGLAISRSIVEAHGGKISAESGGFQKGATFTLTLPLKISGGLNVTQKTGSLKERRVRRLRVLLVEDHADTRVSMERVIGRLQHEASIAATASEALRLAAEREFDLVISDLGLPDMSGAEMMVQLRDRHGLGGIAVSGYGMQEDVDRSRKAGFDYHLTKPIKFEILRDLLEEIASKPGQS